MDKITRILVPFDFSYTAVHALKYAVNFVKNRTIKIHLLYISEHPDFNKMRDTYQDLCDTYERQLQLPLRWIWGNGKLVDTILEVQRDKEVDLIIMGTSALKKEMKTSNTAALVSKTSCPVIVVPEQTKKTTIQHISLVMGETEIDQPKTLKTLLDISRKFNAKVHVLTIENKAKVYGYSLGEEKNENTISYYLEDFYEDHTFIESADIIKGIFSYTKTHDVDMIVIVSRSHAKRSTPSQGLLTKALVLQATIPVLVLE